MSTRGARRLFAIVRHGDRCPLYNAYEGVASADGYAAAWRQRVLRDEDAADSQRCFPVRNDNVRTIDTGSPWGNLTRRGAAQMEARGAQLADGGTHHAGSKPCSLAWRFRGMQRQRFPDVFRAIRPDNARPSLSLRASNFRRTCLSLQHVALGVVPWARSASEPVAAVAVIDQRRDAIAAFDAASGLTQLLRAFYSTEAFLECEARVSEPAIRIARALPYFHHGVALPDDTPTHPHKTHRHVHDLFQRFMWIRALDYFWCHTAHGMHIEPSIRNLEAFTHSHMLWRWRSFFQETDAMRLAAAELLHDAVRETASGQPGATIYGGHDTTLSPLLQHLCMHSANVRIVTRTHGEEVLAAGIATVQRIPWPAYSAALTFRQHAGHSDRIEWTLLNAAAPGAPTAPDLSDAKLALYEDVIEMSGSIDSGSMLLQ